MAKPDLRLVDPDDDGLCGAETTDGAPCQRPAGPEGRCWQHEDADSAGPQPPEHLEGVGIEEWDRRIDELTSAGVLEQVDLGLLEQACEMYQEARRCQKAVADHGHIVQGRNGVKKNPASAKHIKYRKEYRLSIKELRRDIEDASPSIEPDEDVDDPWTGY